MQYLDTYTSSSTAWNNSTLPSNTFGSEPYSRRSFDEQSGRLQSRTYGPGAGGVSYTYHGDGRLGQRTWTGGATAAYTYNPAGRLAGVNYSDSTPDMTFTYTPAGLVKTRSDAGGEHSFSHQPDGDVTETVTGGILNGLTLVKRLNNLGQVESLEWSLAGHTHKALYTYDSQGRLETA